ncbi:MAG: uncharacterized protein KVP18_004740 [Porospora cf. gigantea A]|uniref:uncharacterized protein n=1 Tax=Porospora cf. gigantea A TaxID=2853593 RepID=UPI00355A99D4|nr:MAG: hypothetical protein KVP18_004740 [Porospora cf. gigantea A]
MKLSVHSSKSQKGLYHILGSFLNVSTISPAAQESASAPILRATAPSSVPSLPPPLPSTQASSNVTVLPPLSQATKSTEPPRTIKKIQEVSVFRRSAPGEHLHVDGIVKQRVGGFVKQRIGGIVTFTTGERNFVNTQLFNSVVKRRNEDASEKIEQHLWKAAEEIMGAGEVAQECDIPKTSEFPKFPDVISELPDISEIPNIQEFPKSRKRKLRTMDDLIPARW